VIAGDGRTLSDAREIWDSFRIVFHEDKMVKSLFKAAFGLNPDSNALLPDPLLNMLLNPDSIDSNKFFKDYYVQGISGRDSALPEFNTILDLDIDFQKKFFQESRTRSIKRHRNKIRWNR